MEELEVKQKKKRVRPVRVGQDKSMKQKIDRIGKLKSLLADKQAKLDKEMEPTIKEMVNLTEDDKKNILKIVKKFT